MYIATIPNRNSPPAILLRHAYRENGKVKNRTLANLSHWQSARIEALRRALRGEFDHASLSAEPTLGPIFGLLYVLKQIAEALGITATLSNTTLGKLALFLVLARLPHQGSRLSAVRWAEDLVFVGDRGMVKSKGKQALAQAGLRYITALTDPQIRGLLSTGTLQLGLFHEQICEVEGHGVRYVLRKNDAEAAREQHRLEDKLEKLQGKIAARNELVKNKPRCQPEAGQRKLQGWTAQHKLKDLVELKL